MAELYCPTVSWHCAIDSALVVDTVQVLVGAVAAAELLRMGCATMRPKRSGISPEPDSATAISTDSWRLPSWLALGTTLCVVCAAVASLYKQLPPSMLHWYVTTAVWLLLLVGRAGHVSDRPLPTAARTLLSPWVVMPVILTGTTLFDSVHRYGIHVQLSVQWLFPCAVLLHALALTSTVAWRASCACRRHQPAQAPAGWLPMVDVNEQTSESAPAETPSPEAAAGLLSTISFGWIWPLMKQGYRAKGITADVLQDATRVDDAHIIHAEFVRRWNLAAHPAATWWTLTRVLHGIHWQRLWTGGVLLLIYSLASICVPLLLQYLLQWLEDGGHLLFGLQAAAGLFLASLLCTLSVHQFWYQCIRVGIHCQASLAMHVFWKSMNMSSDAKRAYGIGQLTNLLASDTMFINESMLIPNLHWGLWAPLLTVSVAMYFLVQLLGIAAWVALAAIMVPTAISGWIAKRLKKVTANVLACRDQRGILTSEALVSIRTVKSQCWEQWMMDRIVGARRQELLHLITQQYYGGVNSYLAIVGPVLVSAAAFASYTLIYGTSIAPSAAFTALAWFNTLSNPLRMLLTTLATAVQMRSSLGRLVQLFLQPESTHAEHRSTDQLHANRVIELENAAIAWTMKRPEDVGPRFPVLPDLSFTVNRGELVLILGPVGAGKTTLLSAFTGMSCVVSGKLRVNGSIAYVDQHPWLQSMTVLENITGLAAHTSSATASDRVQRIITACGMRGDVASMKHGVNTMVGEHGITLSGGQRQRLALARAVYAAADVYVLDDILSALDGPMGAHVFQHCILGELAGTTRLMVTHQLQYLSSPGVTKVLVLDANGRALACGPPAAVMQSVSAVAATLHQPQSPTASGTSTPVPSAAAAAAAPHAPGTTTAADEEEEEDEDATQETMAHGAVEWTHIRTYLASYGSVWLIGGILAAFVVVQALSVAASWWLSLWVADPLAASRLGYYVGVYAGFGVVLGIVALWRVLIMTRGSLAASNALHQSMLVAVLHAPSAFFDATPVGRLMNRFLKDIASVDTTVRSTVSQLLQLMLAMIGVLAVVSLSTPLVLVLVVILAPPYVLVGQYYRWSARDVQRILSMSSSPILSFHSEMLRGIATIRAFSREAQFLHRQGHYLNLNMKAFVNYWAGNQWVTWWLEVMGCCFIGATALLAVLDGAHGPAAASMFGLALSYAFTVPSNLMWLVRTFTKAETDLVSVERVCQYSSVAEMVAVPPDAQLDEQFLAIDDGRHGDLQLSQVEFRYAPHLPLVLRGVSLRIAAGSKVAVVGRTGAGKSSLTQCLLRLYPWTGAIHIDGMDIAKLSLAALRTGVISMPQDCHLFKGSLAHNLRGPLEHIPNPALLAALDKVGLTGHFANGLDTWIDEGGGNLSGGERQLICLARVLLRPCRMLLCDEATSHVDESVNDDIHRVILGLPCSVLFICHRLQHIAQFDTVVVMSAGQILELGSPAHLLSNRQSALSALVASQAQH